MHAFAYEVGLRDVLRKTKRVDIFTWRSLRFRVREEKGGGMGLSAHRPYRF